MRTPYPTSRAPVDTAAFDDWNKGIQRAMDAYHTEPFAICTGKQHVNGADHPCFNAREAKSTICRACRVRRDKKNAEMREHRRARKAAQ